MDANRLARLLQLIEQNDPLASVDVIDSPEQRRKRDALIFEALAVAIACGYDAGVEVDDGDALAYFTNHEGNRLYWATGKFLDPIDAYDQSYVRGMYEDVCHRFIAAVHRGDIR